jgi:hypothetical protein
LKRGLEIEFCVVDGIFVLGHRGLGEESNYDYSTLKRKGKERESNASYT